MGAGASVGDCIPRASVEGWDELKVSEWVGSIGEAYEPYAETFKKNGINGATLLELEEKDLESLGVSGLHVKRFLSEKAMIDGATYDTEQNDYSAGIMREGDSNKITDGGRGIELTFSDGLPPGLEGLQGINVGSGDDAATKMQAAQRGKEARREMKQKQRSATTIQAQQRGKKSRKQMTSGEISAANGGMGGGKKSWKGTDKSYDNLDQNEMLADLKQLYDNEDITQKEYADAMEDFKQGAIREQEKADKRAAKKATREAGGEGGKTAAPAGGSVSSVTKEMSPGIKLTTSTYKNGKKKTTKIVYEVESSKNLGK